MTTISRPNLTRVAVVRRQHGLITLAQLLSRGHSEASVRHAVRDGHLHRVHRGVYAVGRPDLTGHGRWLAAVLACGDGALLSHGPAALLWGIVERGDERPHVTVPSRGGRRPQAGIRVHRPRTLRPDDVAVRDGIPVTSLIRTLVDAARTDRPPALKAKIRQAERLHRIDLSELAARSPKARRALALYVPGDVDPGLEGPFLELCARYGIPLPQCQVSIGPYRVDFLWAEERLIVETDGAQTHDTAIARADDAIRDRYLTDRGFEVRRYGRAEVKRRAAATARELLSALARRRVWGD